MTQIYSYTYSYILIDKKKNINFFCDLKKISTLLKKNLIKLNLLDIKCTSKFFQKLKKKIYNR